MKENIMYFVGEFHRSDSFPKAMSSSFLSMIPKVKCPQKLEKYMPICLVGCMSKVIVKILAARLKRVIVKVICVTQ